MQPNTIYATGLFFSEFVISCWLSIMYIAQL